MIVTLLFLLAGQPVMQKEFRAPATVQACQMGAMRGRAKIDGRWQPVTIKASCR
ncbi:MAG TPA: hypothetical protein VME69_06565 [Methylocella sp.]|nr:hypothetical protein [Methylocella sp.]